jgi:photoactive yellow protein
MNAPLSVSFDEPQLARVVEKMNPPDIHALPFGAIRLDPDGRIAFYSEAEARLSGYGSRPAMGRHFFTDVAPCLANEDFRGRIEKARAQGHLDIEFFHVGDFDDDTKDVCFRIQSASDAGLWIFTQRL